MKTRNSHGLLQLHVGWEALAYCQCLYRENKALFVSVDLIGEKNQVILEFLIMHCNDARKDNRSEDIEKDSLNFFLYKLAYDVPSPY